MIIHRVANQHIHFFYGVKNGSESDIAAEVIHHNGSLIQVSGIKCAKQENNFIDFYPWEKI